LYERGSASTGAADTKVYDLLVKHGHLVDPDNRREEGLDVRVIGGKLAGVGRHLPAAYARVVIEAEGYLLK
jgi:dihydroorotase